MLFKKRTQVYGDLIKEFKPTIRSLLIQILRQKLYDMRRTKQSIYNEGSVFIPQTDKFSYLPLIYMALVQDDTVVEMIRVNVETSKLLAARKTKFIQFDPRSVVVKKGMKYQDKAFVEVQPDDQKN